MLSAPRRGPSASLQPARRARSAEPNLGRSFHTRVAHGQLVVPVRAAGDGSEGFLNPFYYGKALAEVLNARLGNLAADTLAFVGTADAELRKALDEIQEEVIERAQQEIAMQDGSGSGSGDALGNGAGRQQRGRAIAARTSAVVDEDEIVDDLRAEIASTRSLVQQMKASMTSRK